LYFLFGRIQFAKGVHHAIIYEERINLVTSNPENKRRFIADKEES
jgi:hypothetical protein